MSGTYTTGEMAKLCGVTVRTVQYYDTRGLLTPTDLSEGGRRLYSEADVKKLKLICFLREIGLPLGVIGEILEADNADRVSSLLLDQQSEQLKGEIAQKQEQLDKLLALRQEMKNWKQPSVETLTDIACIMENRKKLRKVHAVLLSFGILADIIEVATLIYWIRTGVWLPFVIGMVVAIVIAWQLVRFMHKNTAYICPECHGVFRPSMKEMFWANHTPRTRKLTCAHCGHKSFCVETHADALEK